jgi:hypothetical protein
VARRIRSYLDKDYIPAFLVGHRFSCHCRFGIFLKLPIKSINLGRALKTLLCKLADFSLCKCFPAARARPSANLVLLCLIVPWACCSGYHKSRTAILPEICSVGFARFAGGASRERLAEKE